MTCSNTIDYLVRALEKHSNPRTFSQFAREFPPLIPPLIRVIKAKAKYCQIVVEVNCLEKQAFVKHKQSMVKATPVFGTGGPTAVFCIGSIRVIIMSRATYDWSDEQIRTVGLAPLDAKFIVAKNPMNYRFAYGTIAKAIFVLDKPGPTPATLKHVRFKKLQRPYFPADLNIPGLQPSILN
ncbi:MlrC C-terminal domain-containing protein [Gimesia aquarii]|uniref:Microcystin LR degradation protein MlrC C-terminal domain-containing protein n=1 Tax=Gimesia aquarii TaxID=2527964 RepID=A0A517WX44_9PLAN|nr:MlrC C-terminal domain-containing protein [Gimesia aquarii]QDU09799.1 hypothetical protein V202x_31960 [Gimesia aquarii]